MQINLSAIFIGEREKFYQRYNDIKKKNFGFNN
jgi:hypothetical protein